MLKSNLPSVKFDELDSLYDLWADFNTLIFINIYLLNDGPIQFAHQNLNRQN